MEGLWIGVLVILGMVAVGGGIAFFSIRNKLREVSRAAFGTDSLVEGWNRQADELVATPKSVSGMTKIYAPQIQKDFPDFNIEEFKNMAENMLLSALTAISAGDISLLEESTKEVKQQVNIRITNNKQAGIREVYERMKVHQMEITSYVKKQGTCMITFQCAVEYLYYKEKDGALLDGDKMRLTQTKYNIELMYVQNVDLAGEENAKGTTCPNCGAPVTNLGAKFCEYCGLAVTVINIKVWNLHQFYEVKQQKL
ncbi:MAG: TIM44-like domain-containing protein [Lachnospiraceae bacterium]|nr:TIM44-like domain-containing protein [Lachnospiraceae bacterium]